MKRIFFAITFRFLIAVSLILLISVLKVEPYQVFLLYLVLSLLLFFALVLRRNSSFLLSKGTNKAKSISIKLFLSAIEFSMFLSFQSISNGILAIFLTQTITHPIKSISYFTYFFKDRTLTNKLLLYPLPILKELRWITVKFIGKLAQRYFPHSKLTQATLINTSHFFRDINEFENKIIQYSNYYKNNILSILVAGCATGQEAYSIAAICEANSIDYAIDAFDLSDSAIKAAKLGRYNIDGEISLIKRSNKLDSLLNLQKYSKYIIKKEDDFIINSIIKGKIYFKKFDITMIEEINKYDFIFARKMLYYLPEKKICDVKKRLLLALKENLPEENLIIDGFSKKILSKHLQ